MSILDSIASSNDVKGLGSEKLPELCSDIREFIIENISETGGHLSSNLGAVELTVAIHRVYDSSRDRIVFDVGHQSYAHKMLTGRMEGLKNMRRLGGLSSFPKPCESDDDAFIAGHASNSISVALGMARARTLSGLDYDVVAVLGDGALTGGLAYEGLSDVGESGEAIVVILNDNGMSIDRSVGGIERLLGRLRLKPRYLNFKRVYRRVVGKIPWLYKFTHRIKIRVKQIFLKGSMFEALGFYYMGPYDGHDLTRVSAALQWARDQRIPVILHALTKKGKGYPPAERDPEIYHGVNPFDPKKGVAVCGKDDFSGVFGKKLASLAASDKKIVAITAAMGSGTGLSDFASTFPERFFDVGIAEGHAVTMAAGMAKQGLTPVFAAYSTFLQRGYDMLIHDVALSKLHVVLAVDRAGLVGNDGETHHGAFDIAYLGSVPGMTILCPSSFKELEEMLYRAVYEIKGPVALRYPRGGEGAYTGSSGAVPAAVLRKGGDLTIVSYGVMINEALAAAEELKSRGIFAEVVKLNTLGPAADEVGIATGEISGGAGIAAGGTLLKSLEKTGRLIAAEDVCAAGCVGRSILSDCAARGICLKAAKLLNLGDGVVAHGETPQLRSLCGIDADGIVEAATRMIKGGQAK